MRQCGAAACTALVMLGGCGEQGFDQQAVDGQGVDDGARLGRSQSRIINGQVDTEHQAVVTVMAMMSACTGSIIHREGSYAYVLTAAHCFEPGAPQQVRVGDDYTMPAQILNVVDFTDHPSYNPSDQTFDFGIVRVSSANSGTPVIPAMTPAEDNLAPGTQVDHVGYGLTSFPSGQTTRRHHVLGTLSQVTNAQISYNQPTAGPCSGDSGGPNLSLSPERIAGVISYGDEQCEVFGVSGRVSAVYDGFIVPYIEQFEGPVLSGSSSASSSSGGSSSAGVGGASSGSSGSSGAGAAGPSGDGWVAGNLSDRSYDGEVLTSGCTLASGTRSGRRGGAFALLAFGLCAFATRRRRWRS
jgi:uncharacterized membrane protein YgcG